MNTSEGRIFYFKILVNKIKNFYLKTRLFLFLRREWCNCDGNVLLFLIMDQVIPRIRDPEWSSFRETVQQYLDQVVFCLYGHPNKKIKVRYSFLFFNISLQKF